MSSGPAASSRPLRRTAARVAVISVVGVLALTAGATLFQATASSAYDDARATFDSAWAQECSSAEALRSAQQDAEALLPRRGVGRRRLDATHRRPHHSTRL